MIYHYSFDFVIKKIGVERSFKCAFMIRDSDVIDTEKAGGKGEVPDILEIGRSDEPVSDSVESGNEVIHVE